MTEGHPNGQPWRGLMSISKKNVLITLSQSLLQVSNNHCAATLALDATGNWKRLGGRTGCGAVQDACIVIASACQSASLGICASGITQACSERVSALVVGAFTLALADSRGAINTSLHGTEDGGHQCKLHSVATIR